MPKINIFKLAEIYCIQFNGIQIIGTHEEIEELCLALEEYLYDEPTYNKLQDEVLSLRCRIEDLESEVEMKRWEEWRY